MFCQKCGEENNDGARFCVECGNPFEDKAAPKTDTVKEPVPLPVKKKRKTGCIVGLSVLAFFILATIFVLFQIPEDSMVSTSALDTESVENMTIAYGDAGETEEVSITILDIDEQGSIPVSYGITSTPDSGKYGLVDISVTNNSGSLVSFELTDFQLLDSAGNQYSPSIIVSTEMDFIDFESINPNLTEEGYLLYNLPDDVSLTDCTLHFSDSLFSSTDLVFNLK